ncbi:MAG TPA: hypothetical protein PKW61_00115 [Tenuifilaceae bacterium]|nr:hypothetical protein [Tenuifilaceae bacterium]
MYEKIHYIQNPRKFTNRERIFLRKLRTFLKKPFNALPNTKLFYLKFEYAGSTKIVHVYRDEQYVAKVTAFHPYIADMKTINAQ